MHRCRLLLISTSVRWDNAIRLAHVSLLTRPQSIFTLSSHVFERPKCTIQCFVPFRCRICSVFDFSAPATTAAVRRFATEALSAVGNLCYRSTLSRRVYFLCFLACWGLVRLYAEFCHMEEAISLPLYVFLEVAVFCGFADGRKLIAMPTTSWWQSRTPDKLQRTHHIGCLR